MSTQTADRLPTQPTEADFSRLASMVIMERYQLDQKCVWSPQEVASNLWDCRNLMTFPLLAFVAMAIARDTRFKDVEDIYLIAAGLIDPDQPAGAGK
ncbi:hypothetical protein [Arthrobacter globiformis]|uniref:hypothetical protein n=1 Tax=Arthrobacter globiformis TaxID=1665 RepID=UPI000B407F16|nr:hypothetical protein [Arthrobacter globiformis]